MEDVVKYIRQCRRQGFNDSFIKKQLKDAGHSDFIIKKAFYGEKQTRPIPSVKPLMFLFVGLAVVSLGMLALLLLSPTSSPTGYAINEGQLIEQAKAEILRAHIDEINSQDLTLQEKEVQIQELRERVDKLFEQIEVSRQQNLKESIELINSILNRG